MSVDVTSTLFSFVTQRAPQLLTEGHIKFNIVHPNLVSEKNDFADLFTNPLENPIEQRRKALEIATHFSSSAYINIDQLKETVSIDFYNFSNWLAINKEKVGAGDPKTLEECHILIELTHSLSEGLVYTIWNNLLYQVILDVNPYLREQLIHILVADKYYNIYVSNTENKPEALKQVAIADVIIPAQLFGFDIESLVNNTTTPVSSSTFNESISKQGSVFKAKKNISESNTLIEELKAWQKKYTNSNTARYKEAKGIYDAQVKANFEENKVLIAEKEVSTTTITALGNVVNTTIIPAHYELPYDIEVPIFSFTPSPEINEEILKIELSQKSILVARKLNLQECSTISEALVVVNNYVSNETNTVFQNTKTAASVVLARGAVISSSNIDANSPYLYYCSILSAQPTSNYYFLEISLENIPLFNPQVVKLDCTVLVDGIPYVTTDISNCRSNKNSLYIDLLNSSDNGIPEPNSDSAQLSIQTSGSLELNDGTMLSFGPIFTQEPLTTESNQIYTDSSIMTVVKKGEEDPTPAAEEDNKPSGYGIKRLGIADYRRVDQTLCCYVPGEVSNIENIMAGEYRERSTRRLRRSEDTTVTEKQTEQESLTDNTVAERFQMQQQSSIVNTENLAASAGVTANWGLPGGGGMTAFGNIASNSSTTQSNSQAVSYGKDVTQRAMQRVVTKTREERTLKIIEEYEEQNKHGFDNRGGSQHVSGVYRWIDAKYKNQVINYGKRLLYEFMIPEPSAFHNVAMKDIEQKSDIIKLSIPLDPRNPQNGLKDYSSLDKNTAAQWASIVGAEIDPCPLEVIYVGAAYSIVSSGSGILVSGKTDTIKIPEGYVSTKALAYISGMRTGDSNGKGLTVTVGNLNLEDLQTTLSTDEWKVEKPVNQYTSEIPYSISFCNFHTGVANISVRTERTIEHFKQWQIKTFNTIIAAYEKKVDDYNAMIQQNKSDAANTSNSTNPLFFRQLENLILQKNCLHYLLDRSSIKLGTNFYTPADVDSRTIKNLMPDNTAAFDKYASYASFLEKAFEWNIMSYEFLPFYWGNKENWTSMYRNDEVDPLFHSFLQAGIARVVVSVKEGFEKAVLYFMATGKPWDGGTVPVIGDPLFLSIVEDLKITNGEVEETWETTVPTTLTGIQKGTVSIDATGLPCDCGDDNDIKAKEDVILSGIKVTG